jgi:hypothetical protein
MKFLIQLITIFILAYVFELFLPWYSVALAAFAMGWLFHSNANFLAGFLGIGLLWLAKAWLIDSASLSPLADNVARLLVVKQKALLYLVMMLLGGLVGGFAAMAGSALRVERKKYY